MRSSGATQFLKLHSTPTSDGDLTVIVGAGNAFRRDDGAGLATAWRLHGALSGDNRLTIPAR